MILALLFSSLVHAATPSPAELLAASDRARGAAKATKGLTWTSEVTSVENGDTSKVTYSIRVLGNDALAEVKDPPRQKGEVVLFNDRTLWFYKPGQKKPINISPRQKLIGQAANGDIASTQYARDYDATSAGEESVNGKPAWKLELKAKDKKVTYDRIRYWVSKDKQVALKAEFLTLSGETFKIAEFQYGNDVVLHGEKVPFVSEMKIHDANNEHNVTTLTYRNPKEEAHSPGLFNVSSLVR
jgi:outer membrane lipoprotein-sorting protein